MAELGEGPIEDDLRKLLSEIDSCLSLLREKLATLDRVKGNDDDRK